jgi:hypothetical protein
MLEQVITVIHSWRQVRPLMNGCALEQVVDLEHRLAAADRDAEDKERATEVLKSRISTMEAALAAAAAAAGSLPSGGEASEGGEERIKALEVERDALSAQLRVANSSLERVSAERDAAVAQAGEGEGGESLGGGGSSSVLDLKKQVKMLPHPAACALTSRFVT